MSALQDSIKSTCRKNLNGAFDDASSGSSSWGAGAYKHSDTTETLKMGMNTQEWLGFF
jgi:hypothetical protein